MAIRFSLGHKPFGRRCVGQCHAQGCGRLGLVMSFQSVWQVMGMVFRLVEPGISRLKYRPLHFTGAEAVSTDSGDSSSRLRIDFFIASQVRF